jgi:toxin CcdB
MPQWDVFVNPSPRLRDELPYVVLLQSDLLSSLATRWVAPLARDVIKRRGLPPRMSPSFDVRGEAFLLVPQEAAAIDAKLLKRAIANLAAESHRIVDALDAVISGV